LHLSEPEPVVPQVEENAPENEEPVVAEAQVVNAEEPAAEAPVDPPVEEPVQEDAEETAREEHVEEVLHQLPRVASPVQQEAAEVPAVEAPAAEG
jgi:hypothetical protein